MREGYSIRLERSAEFRREGRPRDLLKFVGSVRAAFLSTCSARFSLPEDYVLDVLGRACDLHLVRYIPRTGYKLTKRGRRLLRQVKLNRKAVH